MNAMEPRERIAKEIEKETQAELRLREQAVKEHIEQVEITKKRIAAEKEKAAEEVQKVIMKDRDDVAAKIAMEEALERQEKQSLAKLQREQAALAEKRIEEEQLKKRASAKRIIMMDRAELTSKRTH